MYPTIVFLLVNRHRSFVDTYGLDSTSIARDIGVHGVSSRPATVGHLSFALPPTTSISSTESARTMEIIRTYKLEDPEFGL